MNDREIMRRFAALERRITALLFMICFLIVWLAAISFGGDIETVNADRATLSPEELPFYYYFTTERVPEQSRDELSKVLAFTVVSTNTKVVIEQQLPLRVSDTVYRIDLRQLGWEVAFPAEIAKSYPYSRIPGQPVAMVRGDWFVQWVMDQSESKTFYHELLFGRPLKNLDDFLAQVGAQKGSLQEFGWVEDKSSVANNGTRLLTTVPTTQRHDVWITYDFEKLDRTNDPLEHLDRKFQHDASEVIGGLVKSVSGQGLVGLVQVYALANGKGEIQFTAPTSIVTDHTGIRGTEIVNPVSCVVCHEEGLRPMTQNAVRQFIKSGAEIYADYNAKEDIERFHLTQIESYRVRHNEDYAIIVAACTGMTIKENAHAMKSVVVGYDKDLTLERAALELSCSVEELQLSLANYGKLPARLAQLAQGVPISRSTWESEYRTAWVALELWRNR